MDAPTRQALEDLFLRESASLLQYVGEAFPWAPSDQRPALAKLQQVVREDRQSLAELYRFLQRHRAEVHAGGVTYPASFTGLAFLSLDHLLTRLVEAQRQAVDRVERDLAAVQAPEAKELVGRMLEQKRRHLTSLEELKAALPRERVAS
jgi:hypothetical protein